MVSKLQVAVHEHFQIQKVVNPQKQIQKILASHFKNHQYRFEYLISFTQRGYKSLAFQRIVNIESGIEERQSFPENFKWLKGNIGEISLQALKGRNLQETDIIEIGKIGILVFGEIEAEYRFSYSGASGKCVIRFGFPNYFDKRSHIEFETKIQKLDLDNQYAHVSKETVKRYLLAEFLSEKHKMFEEFKNANKADDNSKGLDNQYLIEFPVE